VTNSKAPANSCTLVSSTTSKSTVQKEKAAVLLFVLVLVVASSARRFTSSTTGATVGQSSFDVSTAFGKSCATASTSSACGAEGLRGAAAAWLATQRNAAAASGPSGRMVTTVEFLAMS